MCKSSVIYILTVLFFIEPIDSFNRFNFCNRHHFHVSVRGRFEPPNGNNPPTFLKGSADDEIPENGSNRSGDGDNIIVKQWKTMSVDARDDFKTIGGSFLFALIVRLFLIEPRFIPSLSMYPTFDIGDQLLVDKISKIQRPYTRRDVVVFNPSETYTTMTGNTEALIKRVVAVAGDTVQVKDKKLYVNGIIQDEPYINEDPDYELTPKVVPVGMLLVLGDNRNHSFDSHVWGFLPEKNVIGRAVVKYWPPWRVGFIEGST